MMKRYKNLGGNSGIKRYASSTEAITIEFVDGSTYLYNVEINGKHCIETMKMLAEKGVGLTTFINQEVKTFAQKIS